MTVKSHDLTGVGVVSGPYTHEEIRNKPGVYRMNADRIRAPILVVMNDGRNIYVNDGWVQDFLELEMEPTKCQFWLSEHPVPDEITEY